MATVLDRVPLDDIRAEARDIQFARVLLTLLAVPFVVTGWLAHKTWVVLWGAVAFSVAAVKVGWKLAGPQPAPDGGD